MLRRANKRLLVCSPQLLNTSPPLLEMGWCSPSEELPLNPGSTAPLSSPSEQFVFSAISPAAPQLAGSRGVLRKRIYVQTTPKRKESNQQAESVGYKITINTTDRAQLHHKLQTARYSSFLTMEKINHQLQHGPSASQPSQNLCEILQSSCLKEAEPSTSRAVSQLPQM